MSCLCVWLSAPNKHSIRTVFFATLLSRSLPTAALPSSPIISLLSPGGGYPKDKLSPNGVQKRQAGLHRLQHSSYLLPHWALRTETQTQTRPMSTIVRGWRVDSNVTPCLVWTGLPLSLSLSLSSVFLLLNPLLRRLKERVHIQNRVQQLAT